MTSGDSCADVYELLWSSTEGLRQEMLKLPFLQHLKLGDLQADNYVTFMIQDINYLMKVTDMLKKMVNKKIPGPIGEFMEKRSGSYKRYAEEMLTEFNLKDVSDIKPIPAMQKYLSDYETIINKDDPIFFVVSLLPCVRLWLWLANEFEISYGNAYFIWKKNNMHGDPAKHYRDLLNTQLKNKDQIAKAGQIFHQQMQNEFGFFAASLNE